MAYIGRDISSLSDRVVLDNITASATATFNLLLNGVAFVPSSAESLTVSLNGVIQKPQTSYTVSNATIVFASALTSSDSIDFILAERAITLTTVGSGSVGTSQLVDGSVSNAKLENSSITLNGSAVSLGGSATISSGVGSVETWVNFNGTGTPSIRGSGNVSSISDNGTGSYTVNFSNNLTDANYAVVASGDRETGERQIVVVVDQNNGGQSNSSVGIATINNDNPYRDAEIVGIGILR
jgi:hypothetical protein